MRVVDANVLLYAVNADTEHHAVSRRWLDHGLSGADTIGFTWLAVTAFLRISTRVGVFPAPLSARDAVGQARAWLEAPGARVLEPHEPAPGGPGATPGAGREPREPGQ